MARLLDQLELTQEENRQTQASLNKIDNSLKKRQGSIDSHEAFSHRRCHTTRFPLLL